MKLLEDKILKEGRVIGTDILKVDCFLNHQIDVALLEEMGMEVAGVGIAVEKSFQGGGDELRKKGIRIESLARVAAMSEENGVEFVK